MIAARGVLALVALHLAPATPAAAQAPPLWGALKPGRHDVGFRRVQRSGHGGARIVQVDVWYPAVCGGRAPMRFGAYLAVSPVGVPRDERASSRAASERYYRALARDSAAFARLSDTRTAACLDAPADSGRHPVLVYLGGGDGRAADNTVLAEYFASHGYVVAAVASADAEVGPVLDVVGNFPGADTSRVAIMGRGTGAAAARRAAGSTRVDALVELDPGTPHQDMGPPNVPSLVLGTRANQPHAARDHRLAVDLPRTRPETFSDDGAVLALLGRNNPRDHRGLLAGIAVTFLDDVLQGWDPSLTRLSAQLAAAGLLPRGTH